MVETLLDKPAEWISGTGQDADIAVYSQCRLNRNLADYSYPAMLSDAEKRSVEERVISVLDSLNMSATGTYLSLTELSPREAQFLFERRLIGPSLLHGNGPRGAYIADDQSMSIAVNGDNHITITALASGLQLQEAWARINLVDDTLAGVLDYAFDERLGYLTASLGDVGTGVKGEVLLHLPGVAMAKEMLQSKPSPGLADTSVERLVQEKRHRIGPQYGTNDAPQGDLFRIQNLSTLGQSEEEILFHLRHLVADIIAEERESRQQLLSEAQVQFEDRVARAHGTARRSRILAFREALSVLSSLRLGVSCRLLEQFSLQLLNEVFIASHDAHIQMKCGQQLDELTLSTERADLFRSRFA